MAMRSVFETLAAIELRQLPYYAIVLTLLYSLLCFLIRYLIPQCGHITVEEDMRVTTLDCGFEGMDNTVLAFSIDFFIAMFTACLAIHLYMTTNRKILCSLCLLFCSSGYLFKGLATRYFGNNGINDGHGMKGFYFLTLFQYLLWTTSTVFVVFLIHDAWKKLDEDGRICGSLESKIACVLNILSCFVVVSGCFWNGMAGWNLASFAVDKYDDSRALPIQIEFLRIGQLAWHGTECLVLIAAAYVFGALAKQDPRRIGGLENHRAASGILILQITLAGFVFYYAMRGASGTATAWAASDGSSVANTFINYFMLMTNFFTHNLLYTLFYDKTEAESRCFLPKFIGNKTSEEDTDEFESSEDDSKPDLEVGFVQNPNTRQAPVGKEEISTGWLFHIFPTSRQEVYDMMSDDQDCEDHDKDLQDVEGSKIVVRTITTTTDGSTQHLSPEMNHEEIENAFLQFSQDHDDKPVKNFFMDEAENARARDIVAGHLSIQCISEETEAREEIYFHNEGKSQTSFQDGRIGGIEVSLDGTEVDAAPSTRKKKQSVIRRLFPRAGISSSKLEKDVPDDLACKDTSQIPEVAVKRAPETPVEDAPETPLECLSFLFASLPDDDEKTNHKEDKTLTHTSQVRLSCSEEVAENSVQPEDTSYELSGTTIIRMDELDPSLRTRIVDPGRKNDKNFKRQQRQPFLIRNTKGQVEEAPPRIDSKTTDKSSCKILVSKSESNVAETIDSADELKTPVDNGCQSSEALSSSKQECRQCGDPPTAQGNDEYPESRCFDSDTKVKSPFVTGGEVEMIYERIHPETSFGNTQTIVDEPRGVPPDPVRRIRKGFAFRFSTRFKSAPFHGRRISSQSSQPLAEEKRETSFPLHDTIHKRDSVLTNCEDGTVERMESIDAASSSQYSRANTDEKGNDTEQSSVLSSLHSESEDITETSSTESNSNDADEQELVEEEVTFHSSLLHILNPFKNDDECLSGSSSSESERSSLGLGDNYVVSFESSKYSTEDINDEENDEAFEIESGADTYGGSFSASKSRSDLDRKSSRSSYAGLNITRSEF